MELLKVDDFVDGVVGIVWFDGMFGLCGLSNQVTLCWEVALGTWLGSIDGLAFVSNGLVIFW